jgi:hypothetical protein
MLVARINQMVSKRGAGPLFGGGTRENVANKVNDLKTTPARKPLRSPTTERGDLIVLPAAQRSISEAIRRQ